MQDQEDTVIQTVGGLVLCVLASGACLVLTGGWFLLD